MKKSFNQDFLLIEALKDTPEKILELLSNGKQAALTYINKVAPEISNKYNEVLSYFSEKLEKLSINGFFEKHFGVSEEEADQDDIPYY